jgi:hypothetical protein
MTDEEMILIEERLKKAESAKERIENLKAGIEKLRTDDLISVRVDFADDGKPTLLYRSKGDLPDRWSHVCWARDEAGIETDIKNALYDVLHKRFEDARSQWQAA